jgi:surfactin synthase thioesterase subunit
MKPQLFLLHYAGGSCYSFQFIAPFLTEFETAVIELPGRGRRMSEGLINSFDKAADDVFRQIGPRIRSVPFLIYGHSMGAYLGLRVSGMLSRSGVPPACLIVSGNPGPGITDEDPPRKRYKLPHDEFIEALRELGGAPDELLEDKELLDFYEPILRADFEVAEENTLDNEAPLNIHLYAIMGSEEKKHDQIANWGRYTTNEFGSKILEGKHFFIFDKPREIAAIIKQCHLNTSAYVSR